VSYTVCIIIMTGLGRYGHHSKGSSITVSAAATIIRARSIRKPIDFI